MPNLGVTIWRTILNIKLLCFPGCVPELRAFQKDEHRTLPISPQKGGLKQGEVAETRKVSKI